MNSLKLLSLCLPFWLLASPLLGQGDSSLGETLASKKRRPTMADIDRLEKIGYFSAADLSELVTGTEKQKIDVVRRQGPRAIAALEAAYPGATYFTVGRDASATYDMLSGFYRSLGQTNRVKRIDFGRGMVKASNEEILGLLRFSGVDFNARHAQILLDVTSYQTTSQIRTLLRVGREGFGGDRPNLSLIWNGVNLTADVNEIWSVSHAALYHQYYRDRVTPLEKILSVNLRDLGHGREWHGSFVGYEKVNDGQYRAKIQDDGYNKFDLIRRLTMERGQENRRKALLWQMWKTKREVSKPSFLAKVKSEAKAMGYRFGTSGRSKRVVKLTENVSAYKKEMGSLLANLQQQKPGQVEAVLEAMLATGLNDQSVDPYGKALVHLDLLGQYAHHIHDNSLREKFINITDLPYRKHFSKKVGDVVKRRPALRDMLFDTLVLHHLERWPGRSDVREQLDGVYGFDRIDEWARGREAFVSDLAGCLQLFR